MTTYHVKTTGNDSTGDGSSGNPWRTIQHGHDSMSNGDTLLVYPGSYNERPVFSKSNITVQGTDEVTRPVIYAYGSANYQNIVSITRGCVFENFEVHGNDTVGDDGIHVLDRGIVVGGSSAAWNTEHITVRNCVVHHVGAAGLMANYQNSALFENNTVYKTAMKNYNGRCWYVDSSGTPGPDYLGYHPGGNSFTRGSNYVIRNNVTYNVWGEGLPFDFGVWGAECYGNIVGNSFGHKIYVGEAQDCNFYQNFLFSSADRGAMNGGGLGLTDEAYTQNVIDIDNVHFFNNIAVDCSSGIWIDHGHNEHNTRNVHIYNNTIIALSQGTAAVNGHGSSYTDFTVRNNIFYVSAAASPSGGSMSSVTFGRNIWSRPPAWNHQGTGDLYQDPAVANPTAAIAAATQLADADANNYKITASSPAINYGDSQIAVDYFGNSRAGLVDTGAHEYDGTAPPPPEIDTAADWGNVTAKDGLHYNTVIQNGEYGRLFNGLNAFVDLNSTGDNFDPDNGAVILRARPAAAGYSDRLAHHLYEAYRWNDSTGKNNLFLIKQSAVNGRIDFSVVVEDEIVTLPLDTSNADWMTFALTWDSGGLVSAYLDGELAGSIAFPGTWLVSGFDFIRAGSGGGSSFFSGNIAHVITVFGETPTAETIAAISEDLANNQTNAAAIGAQVSNFHWHNLRDGIDESEPEAFVVDFAADDTTPEVPQTVSYDLTPCVIPSSEVVDRVELIPYIGATPVVLYGPTMPTEITYEYLSEGLFDVIITVFLTNGESQREIKREYIEAVPPWAEFSIDYTADDTTPDVGQEVTFTLSAVIPGGYPVDRVVLIPGVGVLQDEVEIDGPSMPATISYTYTQANVYTVTVRVYLEGTDLYARETKVDYISVSPAAPVDPDATPDYLEIAELLQMIKDNVAILEAAV